MKPILFEQMCEAVRGTSQVCNFPAGTKEILKFLVILFIKTENRGPETWTEAALMQAELGKVVSLSRSQPVSPQDTQKMFKTPAHWVKLQRPKPQSSCANF